MLLIKMMMMSGAYAIINMRYLLFTAFVYFTAAFDTLTNEYRVGRANYFRLPRAIDDAAMAPTRLYGYVVTAAPQQPPTGFGLLITSYIPEGHLCHYHATTRSQKENACRLMPMDTRRLPLGRNVPNHFFDTSMCTVRATFIRRPIF